MTDPTAHAIIADAIWNGVEHDYDEDTAKHIANAVVGALAVGGYAIVKVDPDVVQRVLAERSKDMGGEL